MLPRLSERHSHVLQFVNVYYSRYGRSPLIGNITHWLRIPYRTALWISRKLESIGYVDIEKNQTGRIFGIFPLWKE